MPRLLQDPDSRQTASDLVIAGIVDLTGFFALGNIFTAHVTGNLVLAAAAAVRGGPLNLAQALAADPACCGFDFQRHHKAIHRPARVDGGHCCDDRSFRNGLSVCFASTGFAEGSLDGSDDRQSDQRRLVVDGRVVETRLAHGA